MRYLIFISVIVFSACQPSNESANEVSASSNVKNYKNPIDSLFENHKEFIANQFDYPVGKPDAKGYYDAQPFTKNNHLGEDWNAVTGGNSDLGHPIFAIANGRVVEAKDHGGAWGNIIRIVQHQTK